MLWLRVVKTVITFQRMDNTFLSDERSSILFSDHHASPRMRLPMTTSCLALGEQRSEGMSLV